MTYDEWTAEDRTTLDRILETWGQSVPPRPRGPSVQRCIERFTANRFFKYRNDIRFPLRVTHQEAPDFFVCEGDYRYFCEVTTASIEDEQRKLTQEAKEDAKHGQESFRWGVPVMRSAELKRFREEFREALEKSIKKKLKMEYQVRPLYLLVYVNVGGKVIGPLHQDERKEIAGEVTSTFRAKTHSFHGCCFVDDSEILAYETVHA